MAAPRIAVAPEGVPAWIGEAVTEGGGVLVDPPEAEGLVWYAFGRPERLGSILDEAPGARWVQLPWAGVEPYLGVMAGDREWTCGKGVYAEPVAEHALALALAGLRHLPDRVLATSWGGHAGHSLYDAHVTVVGGGGITEALLALLAPLRCSVTVVRKHPGALEGATVVGTDGLHGALATADAVVLALALTPETTGIIGAAELAAMQPHAWLVNVARGAHVVTDDLVAALTEGAIGGAALDVTDPEPLPDGHLLWSFPNCLITPHTANTAAMARPYLAQRIRENVRRFGAGEPLIGPVDITLGY